MDYMLTLWLVLGAGLLGVLVLLIVWGVRAFFQNRADHMRRTYELGFPRGMTEAHVLDFVRSAIGEIPRPKLLQPVYPMVFEKYADHEGKHYYLHMPGHVRTKVDKLLDKKIEGITIEQVRDADDLVINAEWEYTTELDLKGDGPLRILSAQGVASSLDANFDSLDEGEALLMQWVVFPDIPRKPEEGYKDKVKDHTMNAQLRLASKGEDAKEMIMNLGGTFSGVSSDKAVFLKRIMFDVPGRIARRSSQWGFPVYLNAPEFTALMGWPLDGRTGNIVARSLPATAQHKTGAIVLGASNHPKTRGQLITMPHESGDTHFAIMGGSGTGKSEFAGNLFIQKISDPETAGFLLEPAGDLAWKVLNSIPAHRARDVIFFDPLDRQWPIGLNPLRGSDPERVTGHMVGVFKHRFAETWSAHMQRVFTAAISTSTLLDLTLYGTMQLLVNKSFRQSQLRKLKRTQHPELFQEWDWMEDQRTGAVDSSVARLQTLLGPTSSMTRNILSQKKGLDFDWIIREHKILIAPLPAGQMGSINASVIGEIIREGAWNAAIRQRPDQAERSLVLMDEFQHFAEFSSSKSDPFAEARKYKQQYIIANQFIKQLGDQAPTIFNNVATQMVFRMGDEDAKKLKDRYAPLSDEDILNLPKYHAAIRMMTEAGMAPVVTLKTPPPAQRTGYAKWIIENTRANFARPVSEVVAEVMEHHKAAEPKQKPDIAWE